MHSLKENSMDWLNGPVPDGTRGLLLVRLDEERLPQTPSHEYYNTDCVAVRWWWQKGKVTMGQLRIEPDWVTEYQVLGD